MDASCGACEVHRRAPQDFYDPLFVDGSAVGINRLFNRDARYAWALPLARSDAVFPLRCPQCRGAMRIIAFITEPPALKATLAHLGEPIAPPTVAAARGPPLGDPAIASAPDWVDTPQPAPAFDFDPRQYG